MVIYLSVISRPRSWSRTGDGPVPWVEHLGRHTGRLGIFGVMVLNDARHVGLNPDS